MAIKVVCSACKKTIAKSDLYVYKYVGEDKNLRGKIVGYAYPDGCRIKDILNGNKYIIQKCGCGNTKPLIFKGDSICKTEKDFEWAARCSSDEVFLRFFAPSSVKSQYFSPLERLKEWVRAKIEEFAKQGVVNNWYFM